MLSFCIRFVGASVAATSMFALPVVAQTYPSKPIRMIVPFPPGGGTDIQARLVGEKLAQRLGQQVVIDNRGGAAGNIGMEIAARSPADGYTLIIATVGTWTVNPHLFKLPYDVLKDFAPIILVAATPGILAVNPSVPAKTVAELVALARRSPGNLYYGSSGIGGFGHISGELFAYMAKIKMTVVPYKGAAAAMTDLIAGSIQVLFNSAIATVPLVNAGKIRALGTTGSVRLAAMPDLPTIAESGVPGYDNTTWSAIATPARTPQSVVAQLNRELSAVLNLPYIIERHAEAGSTMMGGTPEQCGEYFKSELAKYGRLVKEAGIKAEQ